MNLTKHSKSLWLGFALTFPLFTIKYFRFDSEALRVHVAIPMLILALIILIETIVSLGGKERFQNFFYKAGYFFSGLLVLFIFWHITSIVFLGGKFEALSEVVKLLLGFFCMYGIVIFFPKEKIFYEKFWLVVIWGSAAIVAVFIYRYAFVFRSSFLSVIWEFETRLGRNQLGWYLSFIIPVAIGSLMGSPRKIISVPPLIVLTVALIYNSGRGALITIIAGLIFMIFVKTSREGIKGFYKAFKLFLVIGVIGLVSIVTISLIVDKPEYEERYDTLNPGRVSDLQEDSRYALLRGGLTAFQISPILGLGLGNSGNLDLSNAGDDTHNDYLTIAVTLGLVGLFLFCAILGSPLVKIWPIKSNRSDDISWAYLGACGTYFGIIISFLLINAYTSPIFWIFVGLLLVGNEIDRDSGRINTNKKKISLSHLPTRDFEKTDIVQ